ncbi:hypothetical protein, partial [Streptococcus pneumoniae]|uniref:hypothetical protein n=1 Tax=Streptococcus pneumoniae TaxID=1313 RepID=UPI00077B8E06
MVRSLKARLEKLEEYAGKTEYATTDECISLYVDCLRFAFQQDEIYLNDATFKRIYRERRSEQLKESTTLLQN